MPQEIQVKRADLSKMGLASGEMLVVLPYGKSSWATVYGEPTTDDNEARSLLAAVRSNYSPGAVIHIA